MKNTDPDTHCDTYCEHGGVCELVAGHEGPHDSSYCKWTDDQAISREDADELLVQKPLGAVLLPIYDAVVPRKEQ